MKFFCVYCVFFVFMAVYSVYWRHNCCPYPVIARSAATSQSSHPGYCFPLVILRLHPRHCEEYIFLVECVSVLYGGCPPPSLRGAQRRRNPAIPVISLVLVILRLQSRHCEEYIEGINLIQSIGPVYDNLFDSII